MDTTSLDVKVNKIIIRTFYDKISQPKKKKLNIDISSIIDSFSVIELIIALEEEFNIKIKIDNIQPDNLSSTKNIKKLVSEIINAS